jgi:hypothetical protein
MMATHNKQSVRHIPSIDPRLDKLEDCVSCLQEDVSSIKIGMGYKDKYNGEFREEVETESQSFSNRLASIEKNQIELNTTLNTAIGNFRWTIGLGFGGIISVLILLISIHVI